MATSRLQYGVHIGLARPFETSVLREIGWDSVLIVLDKK